jgi:protocatechuate 3,4-dioxygenase alpha subunit
VRPTPSQTVGPFFSIGLPPITADDGVRIGGTVYDGEGAPVPDALVETWQAERYVRSHTDEDGRFELVVEPAEFVDVSVFARGLLQRVVTRICFGVEAVPAAVPAARRATLLAWPGADGAYRFDIRLQGPGETVFFAL